MNWITEKFKRFKPKLKNLFRVKIGPEGKLWENCTCGAVLYKQDLKENLYVCNKCNKHHHIEPKERFQIFFARKNHQPPHPPRQKFIFRVPFLESRFLCGIIFSTTHPSTSIRSLGGMPPLRVALLYVMVSHRYFV